MTAGRRDHLITLQTYTTTQDEYGEEVQTWANTGTEWAAVFYGKGDERRQAAMEKAQQPAVFQVLSNSVTRALDVKDRIVLGGIAWDIVGIAPDTPKRGEIELAALRGEAVVVSVPNDVGIADFSDETNSGLLALMLEDA